MRANSDGQNYSTRCCSCQCNISKPTIFAGMGSEDMAAISEMDWYFKSFTAHNNPQAVTGHASRRAGAIFGDPSCLSCVSSRPSLPTNASAIDAIIDICISRALYRVGVEKLLLSLGGGLNARTVSPTGSRLS